MRASRLLSVLMLLQARGRMTAHALAAELEVSIRTIYRDIDQLSAADVPVYADRGPAGGFQLVDGYRTKLTGFSSAEAQTLFLAGLPGPAAELGLAEVLTIAQLKLTAALPERTRATANRIAARFHLDPVGWFRSVGQTNSLLPLVANAVWHETYLMVRYKRGEKAVKRKLKPLGLVLKAGVWYLVAQVSESTRTYRVSNILEASASADHFARPKEFDLVKFWAASSRAYEAGLYRQRVVLRVSPRGMAKLDLLGSAVVQAAAETAGPAETDGWRRVVIPVESIDQAMTDLLGLATDAEVLEPLELRGLMEQAARDLLRLYGGAGRRDLVMRSTSG